MSNTCAFIKEDGTPCRARPLIGDQYCINHSQDPKAIEKKAAAVRKGGRARTKPDAIADWARRPIDTTEDLRLALSELLNAGMCGTISTSQLSALASVSNVLYKLLDPPKGDGTNPDSMRIIMLRFLDERHPELIDEFNLYLEELDAC